ncbi:MAG: class I adenylate-forming enzyme family protein [Acidimicrobiales bacterium]
MVSVREEPVGRLIERVSGPDPDRVALIIGGVPTTYGELDNAVRSCAAALRAAGVEPGWRIPLVDDTSVLAVATLIGASRIGAAAALMNPRLTSDEIGVLMDVARTGPIGVAGAPYGALLRGTGRTSVLGAHELTAHRAGDHEPLRVTGPDEETVVLFTSGTTGTPKAVPLPQSLVLTRIEAYAPTVDPVPAVSLMCVPFVHIGGMLGLMVALARGSTTVVQTRFDAGEWLALVEQHGVNTSFVVPTMLHRILEHADFAGTDLGSLASLTYGAAPASPQLIRAAMDGLPGVALTNTFGQTETMGSITALGPGDHPQERLASVGRPLPGVEVRIVDPVTRESVPTGTVGELWVKSESSVVPASLTADSSMPDGWFRTGDMVSADQGGYLYPSGRLVDTINRAGEKFSPSEVEEVVRTHPGVRDVAVVGVPDVEMGSRVGVAAVVRQPVALDELREHCAARLAPFKLPERLIVMEEIPYNDFGKVDRKQLRAEFEAVPSP